jgi:surface polysaccharide O-acyltransferase-like enzyme
MNPLYNFNQLLANALGYRLGKYIKSSEITLIRTVASATLLPTTPAAWTAFGYYSIKRNMQYIRSLRYYSRALSSQELTRLFSSSV